MANRLVTKTRSNRAEDKTLGSSTLPYTAMWILKGVTLKRWRAKCIARGFSRREIRWLAKQRRWASKRNIEGFAAGLYDELF